MRIEQPPAERILKNDERDAEAIAEAATRPTMRFVGLKSQEQLDLQSLHRVRERLVGERTALVNRRIEELHRAGTSINGIHKERGIGYGAAWHYVRALEQG